MAFCILISDDHEGFRSLLRQHLQRVNPDAQIHESTASEMYAAWVRCKADMVIMDVGFAAETVLEAARHIKEKHPRCAIYALSLFDANILSERPDNAHIKLFIPKSEAYGQLGDIVRTCASGRAT